MSLIDITGLLSEIWINIMKNLPNYDKWSLIRTNSNMKKLPIVLTEDIDSVFRALDDLAFGFFYWIINHDLSLPDEVYIAAAEHGVIGIFMKSSILDNYLIDTCLEIATKFGQVHILDLILNNHPEKLNVILTNVMDYEYGKSLCMIAAEYLQLYTLQWLRNKGSSWYHLLHSFGIRQCYHSATVNQDVDMIEWLLDNTGNLSYEKSECSLTAYRENNIKFLEYLFSGKIRGENFIYYSLLQIAITDNKYEVIDLIFKYDTETKQLITAIQNDDCEAFKLFEDEIYDFRFDSDVKSIIDIFTDFIVRYSAVNIFNFLIENEYHFAPNIWQCIERHRNNDMLYLMVKITDKKEVIWPHYGNLIIDGWDGDSKLLISLIRDDRTLYFRRIVKKLYQIDL